MKFWLPLKNKKVTSIQLASLVKGEDRLEENLKEQIKQLDQKISDLSKSFLDAQTIKIKYALSARKGILYSIQKQFYLSAADESAGWHKDRLVLLCKERKLLQRRLEKVNGSYWRNQIIRFLSYIAIGLALTITIWIFIMGIIAALYLLPICLLIGILIIVIKRRFPNHIYR